MKTQLETIPTGVIEHMRVWLFTRCDEARRVREVFLRAYGRERGLWEMEALGHPTMRVELAADVRKSRGIFRRNGFRLTRGLVNKGGGR